MSTNERIEQRVANFLVQAIVGHYRLEIRMYRDSGTRVIEPQVLYDNGSEPYLACNQVSGFSTSGTLGWKTIRVRLIHTIYILPYEFEPLPYTKPDGLMIGV